MPLRKRRVIMPTKKKDVAATQVVPHMELQIPDTAAEDQAQNVTRLASQMLEKVTRCFGADFATRPPLEIAAASKGWSEPYTLAKAEIALRATGKYQAAVNLFILNLLVTVADGPMNWRNVLYLAKFYFSSAQDFPHTIHAEIPCQLRLGKRLPPRSEMLWRI